MLLAAAVVGLIVASLLYWQSRSQSVDDATVNPEETVKATVLIPTNENAPSAEELSNAEMPSAGHSLPAKSDRIRAEMDDLMAGNVDIADFLLRHLALAQEGDADSAEFTAQAMLQCMHDIGKIAMTIQHYGIDAASTEEMEEQIVGQLVGMSDFYLAETRRQVQRFHSCAGLQWSRELLLEEAAKWQAFAVESGQPISVSDWAAFRRNDDVTEEQLATSKALFREALKVSKDYKVFLNASTVTTRSTGNDYLSERLSWALLACEYDGCDSLNAYYRSLCDVREAGGDQYCFEGMTNLDYLTARHPDKIDFARSRAQEIKQAIEEERWELIGLD